LICFHCIESLKIYEDENIGAPNFETGLLTLYRCVHLDVTSLFSRSFIADANVLLENVTVGMLKMTVFWVVPSCGLGDHRRDDGGSNHF
jgi:hypothetical protein